MAVQRLTLDQIETAVLQIMGYSESANAPWTSQPNLWKRINEYMQRLPMRLNTVAREMATQGLLKPTELPLHFDMWLTEATSAATGTGFKIAASASTAYMPTDFDAVQTCYDLTGKRYVPVVESVDKWMADELTNAPPGTPKCIKLLGYALDGSDWRRSATIYPSTVSGVTPSMRLAYFRLPAIMVGTLPTAEYPDIDPKYGSISIYGTVCDLARGTGFEFTQYAQLEREMLTEMCLTARSR
jgi:hypothetical protein